MIKCLYFLVLVSPLLFGSVQPIFQMMWIVYCGTLLLLHSKKMAKTNGRPHIDMAHAIQMMPKLTLIGFSIFFIVGIAQLVPFGSIFQSQGSIHVFSISSTPYATIKTLLQSLAYLCVVLFSIIALQNRRDVINFLAILLHIIVAYAVYGFVVFFSGNDTILGFEKTSSLYSLSSTFVNRNNFATFCGMGLVLSITQMASDSKSFYMVADNRKLSAEAVTVFFSSKTWLYVLEAIFLFVCLILSDSRAGVASTLFSIVILLILDSRSSPRNSMFLFGSFLVSIFGVFLFSGTQLQRRLTESFMADDRFVIYPIIIEGIADKPFFGHGLGSFSSVFPSMRSCEVHEYFIRAHSDFLELFFTVGVATGFILCVAFCALILRLWRNTQASTRYKPETLAGLGVVLLFCSHALVDFPFQIPALGYMAAAILGASLRAGFKSEVLIPIKSNLKSGLRQ